MNVRTLIVSKAVADTMIKCAEMVVDPNYGKVSGIQRVGMYGRYPVWIDPCLDDNKVMVTYKADSGDDAPDKGMVERWNDKTGEDWILLSDSPRETNRETHRTTTGGAQGAP